MKNEVKTKIIGGETGGEIGDESGVKTGGEMEERRKDLILYIIKSNPSISYTKIANYTGLPIKVVEKLIKGLKDAKILIRIGSARGGHWEIQK